MLDMFPVNYSSPNSNDSQSFVFSGTTIYIIFPVTCFNAFNLFQNEIQSITVDLLVYLLFLYNQWPYRIK